MLADPDAIDLLRKSPLFEALSAADLSRISHEMHERAFDQNQQIFARGDTAREIFLVIQGRVRLSVLSADGRSLSFSHACDGDVFGEIAVLDGGLRSADATALTKVRALTLSRAALRRVMAANPQVAQAAITFLCRRLRATSEQLEEVVLNPIEVRLARFLLHVHKMGHPQDCAARTTIDLGMSQSELALLIGATRQTVNTAITTLEKGGALKRLGAQLDCDIAQLAQVAGLD